MPEKREPNTEDLRSMPHLKKMIRSSGPGLVRVGSVLVSIQFKSRVVWSFGKIRAKIDAVGGEFG